MHAKIYNKNRPEALLNTRRSERRYGERGVTWIGIDSLYIKDLDSVPYFPWKHYWNNVINTAIDDIIETGQRDMLEPK